MNKRTSQRLSLEQIREIDGIGRKVAEYIFPYVQRSGLSNQQLTEGIQLKSHTNTSMMRSGRANLPIMKVPLLAELIKCDPYVLGYLALECHSQEEHETLLRLGVIIAPEERQLHSQIQKLLFQRQKSNLIEQLYHLVRALKRFIALKKQPR